MRGVADGAPGLALWRWSAGRHRAHQMTHRAQQMTLPCSTTRGRESAHSAPRQALHYLMRNIRCHCMLYYFLIPSACEALCGPVSAFCLGCVGIQGKRQNAHRRPRDAPQRSTAPRAHRWRIFTLGAPGAATERRKAPPRITRSRAEEKPIGLSPDEL